MSLTVIYRTARFRVALEVPCDDPWEAIGRIERAFGCKEMSDESKKRYAEVMRAQRERGRRGKPGIR